MGCRYGHSGWILSALVALTAGCEGLLTDRDTARDQVAAPAAVRIVERDVEAPEVFQIAEEGLWDGRPSLGGVWVAHPDVQEPERVIIRNLSGDAFVIGALFHRERVGAGPALQVSSDAAEALGLIPGQPQRLDVTALRRESVPEEPEVPVSVEEPAEDAAETPESGGAAQSVAPPEESVAPPEDAEGGTESEISVSPLAAAEAAIARSEDPALASRAVTATEPPARATPRASSLDRPFIQIGLFSRRENAESTDARLRGSGILPTIREQVSDDRTYWRVVVGPAGNRSERAELLAEVRKMGFSDAYFVAD